MAAILVEITDAVVAELADGVAASAFTRVFTPARVYDALFELKDSALHIEVVPAEIVLSSGMRNQFHHEVTANVIIREKLSSTQDIAVQTAQMDGLLLLEEAVARYLTANDAAGEVVRRLADATDAASVGPARVVTPYIPEHFVNWRQFTGVIAVSYGVWR